MYERLGEEVWRAMEKLDVGVADWFAVVGINNLQINNEINTGLILANVCTDKLALDICGGLVVLNDDRLFYRLTERTFSIVSQQKA
jgi:hypothetical protein